MPDEPKKQKRSTCLWVEFDNYGHEKYCDARNMFPATDEEDIITKYCDLCLKGQLIDMLQPISRCVDYVHGDHPALAIRNL